MNPKKIFILILVVAMFLVSLDPAFAQVETAWVRSFSGPGNSTDMAYAIAVDSCGNVYVTGCSGSGPDYDYVTIKYYPNGNTAWLRRYNGSSNDERGGQAIAVYGCERVYVTGIRGETVQNGDLTIAYDATNGDSLWIGNVGGVDIAVDNSGNIYVTGMTNYDYLTVKYYPNGVIDWVETYDGPPLGNYRDEATAIAIDDSGYVYVTGGSDSSTMGSPNYAYATIKYDSNGNERWVARYNGPVNGNDVANAIAVDDSGYVYVTGESYSGEKRQLGEERNHDKDPAEWPIHQAPGERWPPPPIWCDYATIKYRSNGDTVWVRRYDVPEQFSMDWAEDIAVDGSGNVYVTGTGWGDYLTIKYLSNGFTDWAQRYNGPGNDWDWAKAITVDDFGCIYVTGYSPGSGTYNDYATIKYYPNGATAWVRRYNGPANSYDEASAISVDGSGNVYVTGGSIGSGTGYDYATIKYVPLGWVYPVDPPSFDTPPIKIPSQPGNKVIKLRVLGTCDSGGNYLVTTDHPKVTCLTNCSGYLLPGQSKDVEVLIDCQGVEQFINATITIRGFIGTGDEDTVEIPLYTVCSDTGYYECDRDAKTYIEKQTDVFKLWTCVNTEEMLWDYRIFGENRQNVIFSGSVIAATSWQQDTVVGRQDYKDIRTGAGLKDTITVFRDIDYKDARCKIRRINSHNTYVWQEPTSPNQNPRWYWIDIWQDIITYDSVTCPSWKKDNVIKYVWIKKSPIPNWWPTPQTDQYENIYYGYFADINAPFTEDCDGCNTAGHDATKQIMWQKSSDPAYPNQYVGLALTDTSGAVIAPLGAHNVLNEDYLYPQDGWGWREGELYQLATTSGVVIDSASLVEDRSWVVTAGKIDAGTANFSKDFILIETSTPSGLATLQTDVDSARSIVKRQLNAIDMQFFNRRLPICCDCTDDGIVNSADIVCLVNYMFAGGPKPNWPLSRADCTGDGIINSADIVCLVNYMFAGGPKPTCPFNLRYE